MAHDHPFLSVPGLAETWKPFLRKLLAEDLLRPSMLLKLVDTYHRVIKEEAGRGGHVNLAIGEAIVRSLKTFIARIDDRVGDEERRVIQTAVRYFVIENDANGNDLRHEDGLFDDARVVNAMLRWFGRDDLFVSLPPTARSRRPTFSGSAQR